VRVQVLVLCPNALLCSQVASVAAGLKDSPDAPRSFLRSYQVCPCDWLSEG
jgi:hypothetical protein